MSSAPTEPASPGRGWVRRLAGYMLRHRRDVALSLSAALVGTACQAIVPLVERQIVDGVIVAHHSSLWPWLVFLVVLGLAAFGCAYIRRFRGGRVALSVQYDLRNDMHDHLQAMDFATLDQLPTGQLVGRSNSDSAIVQGLLSFFPIMSGNIVLIVLSLAVMLYLSPLLAIVSLVVAPALLVVSYRMRWRVFPATWDAQQREGDIAQIVDEDVNGVRVVKAFGQESAELERLARTSSVLYGAQMRSVRLQARYQPLLEAIPSIGQVALLAFGGYLALHHELTLGTFLAFSTYVAQLMAPARQLAGVLTVGQQARAALERIFQLLDLRPSISDRADAPALAPRAGTIDFRDVHFAYGDGRPVLDGFELHVQAGERVAIVGPSGSGKSTAALLVSRFYDVASGAVLLDGHDVRDVSLASLRRQVGIVFEEAFLFSDSVRANIAYGRPDASDADIEVAARAAQAHDFIAALPKGYDTVVGERGLTLSGGQRQRVALARAILYDPHVLILDDSTSAVDARIEASIHDGLRAVMAGRTTILIAHRVSTLHLADRVELLERGRVTDEGTHAELLARNAHYRRLLSGVEDDALVGDGIEALAALAFARAEMRPGAAEGHRTTTRFRPVTARATRAASLGAGLGRGGGGLNLAPTPDLLRRVEALPPVRDEPLVDVATETRRDPHFSLLALVREFRRPLLVGLVLVVLDSLASLAGPVLVKTGIDSGVAKGSLSVLLVASATFLAVTLVDLLDQVAATFVTGRTAQRIMFSLRIRIFAQLQRLSLDYYEQEMAGRIMTRMTTDVDQFESLMENGLLAALVSLITFVGVGAALIADFGPIRTPVSVESVHPFRRFRTPA